MLKLGWFNIFHPSLTPTKTQGSTCSNQADLLPSFCPKPWDSCGSKKIRWYEIALGKKMLWYVRMICPKGHKVIKSRSFLKQPSGRPQGFPHQVFIGDLRPLKNNNIQNHGELVRRRDSTQNVHLSYVTLGTFCQGYVKGDILLGYKLRDDTLPCKMNSKSTWR